MHRIAVVPLLWLLLAAAAVAQTPDARKAGNELTAAFYARQIDSVWARMDQPMRTALKSRDALASFREQVEAQLGAEQAVVDESVSVESGKQVYRRRANFAKFPGVILVQWVFAADGQVSGFLIAPEQNHPQAAAPSKYLDYRTRTELRLPFADEFLVFWGGRTVAENYHAVHPNQRFAYDLLVVNEHGSRRGDGRTNEDFLCFGTPILAPGAGRVIQVVNDIADNLPGQMNPEQVIGNNVVIDHGNGEFSLLAHLRQGSVRVRPGDAVVAGERIGDCGNSGNSSEPHLHYQLQDGPEFGTSAGLPAQFSNYIADGELIARGEPVRGQRIRAASAH